MAVEAHDSATRDGRINSGDYEFALVGNGGWGNNPPTYMRTLFSDESKFSGTNPHSMGAIGYSNAEMTALAEGQVYETDFDKRVELFQELERHGKKNFEVVFLVMNPGYNEINYETIVNNAKILNVPITVFTSEIFDIVAGEEESPCYLCARMRRGHLYSKAKELGCNKIALGHHFDDVIETILMGMLYGAQVQTMMPKLHSTNFPGMELIRPLYLVREEDIIHWMNYNDLHFIQCACRFTESCASCGGTEKGSKRAEIKDLIRELRKKNPYIEKNIFRSVENVNLNTVIGYKKDGVRHHFLDEYDKA